MTEKLTLPRAIVALKRRPRDCQISPHSAVTGRFKRIPFGTRCSPATSLYRHPLAVGRRRVTAVLPGRAPLTCVVDVAADDDVSVYLELPPVGPELALPQPVGPRAAWGAAPQADRTAPPLVHGDGTPERRTRPALECQQQSPLRLML